MEREQLQPQPEALIRDPSEIGAYMMELMSSMEAASEGHEIEMPYSHLRSNLKERIVGQDEAIDSLIDTLNQEEFRDPLKPIGTFMFLGPTGVGKSQTAKEISMALHDGTEKAFLNINCAQFKNYGDLGVLQGAPPGYKGYEQQSILKEDVVKQPKSVILFDEIEKADASLHDFLIKLMDEGQILMFNTGEMLSLRDSLIILTSNAGSSEINKLLNKKSVGFMSTEEPQAPDVSHQRMTEVAYEALENTFKPEFLGRIENKVLFRHLTDEQHALALHQYIKEIGTRPGYVKRGIFIMVDPELRTIVVEKSPRRSVEGFREVQATFKKKVERRLQELVVSGAIPNHSIVYAEPASEKFKQEHPGAIAEFRSQQFAA